MHWPRRGHQPRESHIRSHPSRLRRAHGSGRDTSHPLPPSQPPQTRSTLQRERWSANICSPGIGPSRGGERRWTLHLWHMTANGSSTPAPHASDSLRNPAGSGGGGGREEPLGHHTTTSPGGRHCRTSYHVCLNFHLIRKDWDTNSKPAELALRGNSLLPPGRRAKIGVRLPWAACTPPSPRDTLTPTIITSFTHCHKQGRRDEWGSSISRHKERSGGFGTSARMSS